MDRLAAGETPPADASVTTVPAPLGAPALVVGGTAWHVVAADVDPAWVTAQVAHDPVAAPLGARFLAALADRIGVEPGVLDAVLVAPPAPLRPGVPLLLAEPGEHPRVVRARRHRTDVRAWTTPDGSALLVLGRGVAGRWEAAIEVNPAARGRGLGTALAAAAPAMLPEPAPLWAQVAPANVASLRAFLAAGWRPVGAEVLFGS
ncbi:GNAT family N-acetyltransferase [Modestobacter muralis]